jgi:hypothetical protein
MKNIESGKTEGTGKPREIDGFENIKGIEGIEDEKGRRSRSIEEIQSMIDGVGIVLPEIPPEDEIARIDKHCKTTGEDEGWFDRTKKKDPEKETGTVKMKKRIDNQSSTLRF